MHLDRYLLDFVCLAITASYNALPLINYVKKFNENYQLLFCLTEKVRGKGTALKVQFTANGRFLLRHLPSGCSLHTTLNSETVPKT